MVINKYTVTFKVTPSSATVNYSIDSQSYNQTTTGAGTVSVPYGSTIYYKISKAGYGTITRSRVVNSNITVTENMVENDYILVSTGDHPQLIQKYTDPTGDSFENVPIPANSNNYKIDGLMYGFSTGLGNSAAYQITIMDVSHLDTSNVINMNSMFRGLQIVTSLNVLNFNTSNVTDMGFMFYNCFKIVFINLSRFNTSKVTNMQYMFETCSSLTSLDLSNFDTSKVTDMSEMFSNCSSLTSLDLSNFDTSKVTNMMGMFSMCSSLTSLDLSNFDTSKVTDMSNMFIGCHKLTHIKCKQAFKDWCWGRIGIINLPTTMRPSGSGTWEIVN